MHIYVQEMNMMITPAPMLFACNVEYALYVYLFIMCKKAVNVRMMKSLSSRQGV